MISTHSPTVCALPNRSASHGSNAPDDPEQKGKIASTWASSRFKGERSLAGTTVYVEPSPDSLTVIFFDLVLCAFGT